MRHNVCHALYPLAWVYDAAMRIRNVLFDHGIMRQHAFPLPVIAVGNLPVGGTGNAPPAEYILRLLVAHGVSAAMLSRGYGRKTRGYVEVAGHPPEETGDEPWQVQHNIPQVRVSVCENRSDGIRHLLSGNAPQHAIELDDAIQQRHVKAGLYILLTDFARPYYEDAVLPAGRLRESRRGAKRADLIIVTKCPETLAPEDLEKIRLKLNPEARQRVFFTTMHYGRLYAMHPEAVPPEQTFAKTGCTPSRVLLLCGIARPERMEAHFREICTHVETAKFRDHHAFTDSELNALARRASYFDMVITTEKDAARLIGRNLPPALRQRLYVQPIEVKFLRQATQEEPFNNIITDYVTSHQTNS